MSKNTFSPLHFLKSALLIVLCTFLLSGCVMKKQSFLDYQNSDISAKATLTLNDKEYSIVLNVKNDGNGFLEYASPSALAGTSLIKEGEKIFCSADGLKVPLNSYNNPSADIFGLFCLSENNLTAINAETVNGLKLNIANFKYDNGEIKLFLSADTYKPIRIEACIRGNSIVLNFSEFNVSDLNDNTE